MKELIEKYVDLKNKVLKEQEELIKTLGWDEIESNDRYWQLQTEYTIYKNILKDLKNEVEKLYKIFNKI